MHLKYEDCFALRKGFVEATLCAILNPRPKEIVSFMVASGCMISFTMEDRKNRIARLQAFIQSSYGCKATYRRTVPVQENVGDGVQWKGEVEVFWLTGHPGAKRCYAWLQHEVAGNSEVIAILEAPPVIGAATAVRAALAQL